MHKKEEIIKILEDVGLSEKESEVYVALLSLGSATILQIARETTVKRSTIYPIIESLKHKGLVKIEIKGFKQKYAAENPEVLKGIYDTKKVRLNDAIAELTSMHNLQGGEGLIKYYQGLQSVKNIYENLLEDIQSGEDYLVIADQHLWYDLDKDYFQNFIERRSKLNINIKLLLTDSEIAHEHKKYEKNYNEEIRILPKETSLTTNLIITPRKVVIQQLTTPIMAIVVENKSIINMHKELFDMLWKSL